MKLKLSEYVDSIPVETRIQFASDTINNLINSLVLNELTSETNVSRGTIRKYMRRNAYPVWFIKKLNELTKRKINLFKQIENTNYTFISKWKVVKIPSQITKNLAYFIGYMQGDGCMESNKKRISFVDESRDQLERVNKMCDSIFGIKGNIFNRYTPISTKNAYQLEIGSKVLNYFIHGVFGFDRGSKVKLNVPELIKSNRELMRSYLIGLFDADGTLPKDPYRCKQLFVDITFKNKLFIEQVRAELQSFQVKTLNPYCRISKSPNSDYISKTWELRIRKKIDIIRFLKEIGFSHPDKSKRVPKVLGFLGQ